MLLLLSFCAQKFRGLLLFRRDLVLHDALKQPSRNLPPGVLCVLNKLVGFDSAEL